MAVLTESGLRKIIKEELRKIVIAEEIDAALTQYLRPLMDNVNKQTKEDSLTKGNGFPDGRILDRDLQQKFGTFTDVNGRKFLDTIKQVRQNAQQLFNKNIGNISDRLTQVNDSLAVVFSDDDRAIFSDGQGKPAGKISNIRAYAVTYSPAADAKKGQINPSISLYFAYTPEEKGKLPVTYRY
jgi:hypothetical protein